MTQVRNLRSSIKMHVAFLSPEAAPCISQMTAELRDLSLKSKTHWFPEKYQVGSPPV